MSKLSTMFKLRCKDCYLIVDNGGLPGEKAVHCCDEVVGDVEETVDVPASLEVGEDGGDEADQGLRLAGVRAATAAHRASHLPDRVPHCRPVVAKTQAQQLSTDKEIN